MTQKCYLDAKSLRVAAGQFFAHKNRSFVASINSSGRQNAYLRAVLVREELAHGHSQAGSVAHDPSRRPAVLRYIFLIREKQILIVTLLTQVVRILCKTPTRACLIKYSLGLSRGLNIAGLCCPCFQANEYQRRTLAPLTSHVPDRFTFVPCRADDVERRFISAGGFQNYKITPSHQNQKNQAPAMMRTHTHYLTEDDSK